MAFTLNSQLNNSTNVLLRDQQHAARLFVDDQFRLAPKFNFLFHVAFGINTGTVKTLDLVQRYGNEIGMLVKSVGLPKFTVTVDQVNQYNRKKQIQTFHKYEDITIKLHDDNMSLINNLWQNYYSYYFADSTSATSPGAYNRNATRSYDYINNPYGLDNGSTQPFFSYIKIYQMARHEYVSYTLYNPIIKSWDHSLVDYASKDTHDFQMTVSYEAVSYDFGNVTQGDPIGFGQEHYDQTLSPLQGQKDPVKVTPSLVNNTNLTNNASSFLSNLVTTNNAYQNTQQTATAVTPGLLTPSVSPGAGGIQNTIFPAAANAANSVNNAQSLILGGGGG